MTDCPSWFFREEHFFLPVNLSAGPNYRESLSSPSRAPPTSIHHHHFSSTTAQCSSCRSKPAGNRFTACLGIFPTPWIPEQEDWSMTKLLFRYCLLKGNPNARPPFKCNFSLRGFERPEDPFHFHLRRLCRDESNFLRGASSGRSNIVVVARTMNSSVSSCNGAK